MTDLQGLIERLEKAEGPDQKLDRDLTRITHKRTRRHIGGVCGCCPGGKHLDLVWVDRATDQWKTTARHGFELTGSIDRALAFSERVRPDWCGPSLLELAGSGRFTIQARDACDPRCAEGSHAKPAIALLIATLRALQATRGGDR